MHIHWGGITQEGGHILEFIIKPGFTADGSIHPIKILLRVVKMGARRQTRPLRDAVNNRHTGCDG